MQEEMLGVELKSHIYEASEICTDIETQANAQTFYTNFPPSPSQNQSAKRVITHQFALPSTQTYS